MTLDVEKVANYFCVFIGYLDFGFPEKENRLRKEIIVVF